MANGNTVIPHGLRADLMRKHMENKNTLTRKGSLYVGTGTTYSSASPDYFGDVTCYKTAELEPPTTKGLPLISKGVNSSNVQQGIEWGQVLPAGIAQGAVIGSAGNSTTDTRTSPTSKIYYNSIANDDIANRTITTGKLVYDSIKIGNEIFKLTETTTGSSSSGTTSLSGMTKISCNEFAGGTVTGTVITATDYFNASSDRRLKKNIKEYDTEKSILDVPVKEYDYKSTGTHTIGFIAQELQEVFPELVTQDPNGFLGIQETKLVYLLMLEVKKLRARVDELENKE